MLLQIVAVIKHLIELIKVFRSARNFQPGVLDLNFARMWPPRNKIGHPLNILSSNFHITWQSSLVRLVSFI